MIMKRYSAEIMETCTKSYNRGCKILLLFSKEAGSVPAAKLGSVKAVVVPNNEGNTWFPVILPPERDPSKRSFLGCWDRLLRTAKSALIEDSIFDAAAVPAAGVDSGGN